MRILTYIVCFIMCALFSSALMSAHWFQFYGVVIGYTVICVAALIIMAYLSTHKIPTEDIKNKKKK